MPMYFPALKAHMGDWQYYNVKMSMQELAGSIELAQDVYDDHTLSDAMQRVLGESRAKGDIARYLISNDGRFFSAIVIAVKDGDPQFYPVTMDDDPRFALLKGDRRLAETFGVIQFNGEQTYYALDGQHRLAAIQAVLDPQGDLYADRPNGFENEEVSVILVIATEDDQTEWRVKHRRLFGNLNRHAKPTDHCTNIIMDEDDAHAILTRRLISEYHLFQWPGAEKDSQRVKTTKGKNLSPRDPFLTTIEGLYDYVTTLLTTPARENEMSWHIPSALKSYRSIFPGNETIDEMYQELVVYWDGLLAALPELANPTPSNLRQMRADIDGEEETENIAYFRPIVMAALMVLSRRLLNASGSPTNKSNVTSALKPLGDLEWNMYSAPWRHLVLIVKDEEEGAWKIRSEDRKLAMGLVEEILAVQLGLDVYDEEQMDSLKARWKELLYNVPSDESIDDLWDEIIHGILS